MAGRGGRGGRGKGQEAELAEIRQMMEGLMQAVQALLDERRAERNRDTYDMPEGSLGDRSDSRNDENPFHETGGEDNASRGGLEDGLLRALFLSGGGINIEGTDFVGKMHVERQLEENFHTNSNLEREEEVSKCYIEPEVNFAMPPVFDKYHEDEELTQLMEIESIDSVHACKYDSTRKTLKSAAETIRICGFELDLDVGVEMRVKDKLWYWGCNMLENMPNNDSMLGEEFIIVSPSWNHNIGQSHLMLTNNGIFKAEKQVLLENFVTYIMVFTSDFEDSNNLPSFIFGTGLNEVLANMSVFQGFVFDPGGALSFALKINY